MSPPADRSVGTSLAGFSNRASTQITTGDITMRDFLTAAIGNGHGCKLFAGARVVDFHWKFALTIHPFIAPLLHGYEDGKKGLATFGQDVFLTLAADSDLFTDHDAVLDKLVEAVCEDVLRDTSAVMEVTEAPGALHGVPHYEECPPVTNLVQSLCNGTRHFIEAFPTHSRSPKDLTAARAVS